MDNISNLFDALEKQGVVIEQKYRDSIQNRLNGILTYQPSVGVFGKTGAGKSSLCNAVFGQDVCEISDVAACTRSPQEVILSMGENGIKLLDVPGVGESNERDREYAGLYKKLLPELDIVLWVLKADDRAFSSDETFYKQLVRPYIDKGRPFFIVLNQVDKIEPFREWDVSTSRPGPKQASNIEEKRRSVAAIFDLPLTSVIPVSANENFGLVELVDNVVHAFPKDKKVIVLKQVRKEYRSVKSKEEAESGFFDTIIDVVIDIAPIPSSLKGVVKKGAKWVKETLSGWLPWNW